MFGALPILTLTSTVKRHIHASSTREPCCLPDAPCYDIIVGESLGRNGGQNEEEEGDEEGEGVDDEEPTEELEIGHSA